MTVDPDTGYPDLRRLRPVRQKNRMDRSSEYSGECWWFSTRREPEKTIAEGIGLLEA